MGGTVTVGFRFSDGTRRVQHRWTNPLPYIFNDMRMFMEDRAYIEDYLSRAEDKQEKPLAPYGYGIVFMDFKTGVLLSSQNYTTFGRISPIGLVCLSDELDDFPNRKDHPDYAEECQRVEALISSGRVSVRTRSYYRREGKFEYLPDTHETLNCDFDGLLALSHVLRERDREQSRKHDGSSSVPMQRTDFAIDTFPIQIRENSNWSVGELRNHFVDLGIPLNSEDMAAWDKRAHDEAQAEREDKRAHDEAQAEREDKE